jgi:hypothetical protein
MSSVELIGCPMGSSISSYHSVGETNALLPCSSPQVQAQRFLLEGSNLYLTYFTQAGTLEVVSAVE